MSTEHFRLGKPIAANSFREGLGWKLQLFVFLFAALIVISRRPDVLTRPQFFAEDGTVFYADAYKLGWLQSLFLPHAGYLDVFIRIAALVAVQIPFLYAPLFMNLVGIVAQVLPVNFLTSSRCAALGALPMRLLMGLAYLAMPNSQELDVVITNSVWHLALLALLVVVASPPTNRVLQFVDLSIIVLSCLSGPYCILLCPVAIAMWWFRKSRWRLLLAGVIVAIALLQVWTLQHVPLYIRSKAPLGASIQLLIDMLAGHVYLAAIAGQKDYAAMYGFTFLCIAAVAGTALLVYVILKAPLEIKLCVSYCVLIFAASLESPLVSRTVPQWPILESAYGIRYWFFPMLALVWSLIWCSVSANMPLKVVSIVLLIFMLRGVTRDWRYPPFPDKNFPKTASDFEAAAPGTAFEIPLYPDGWTLRLTKKEDSSCAGQDVKGHIDEPSPGAAVAGLIHVRGWTIASQPVQRVFVYLDNSLFESLNPNEYRPDVDKAYPHAPGTQKGWQTTLESARMTPGWHSLEIRAQVRDGCMTSVERLKIERKPN
jgi:hypothetical protein